MKKSIHLGTKGFTLVELMIVVAIIGILAAVGIPQYSKFQAKARASDSRVQLGALYTVEQTFRAEVGNFTICINNAGYTRPTASYYTVGFNASNNYAQSGGPGSTNCTFGVNNSYYLATRNGSNGSTTAGSVLADLTATNITNGNQFNAAAAGYVSSTGLDKWNVDDTQNFTNTLHGY